MPFDKPTFLTLAGARVACRESGQGDPLLFVHGFPGSSLNWRKVIPGLEGSFRCLAVDLLGTGYTEVASDADLSIVAQAKMLTALMDKLELPSITLIAHDSGAVIARALAAEAPGRIERFILSDTEVPGHIVPRVAFLQRLLRLPGALRLIEVLADSRRLTLLMAGDPFRDRNVVDFEEYLSAIQKPIVRSRSSVRAALRYAMSHDLRFVDTIPHQRLTMPKLILWGEQDTPLLLSWGRELYDSLPEPKSFVVIPECGILPHEEKPADWLAAARVFLAA